MKGQILSPRPNSPILLSSSMTGGSAASSPRSTASGVSSYLSRWKPYTSSLAKSAMTSVCRPSGPASALRRGSERVSAAPHLDHEGQSQPRPDLRPGRQRDRREPQPRLRRRRRRRHPGVQLRRPRAGQQRPTASMVSSRPASLATARPRPSPTTRPSARRRSPWPPAATSPRPTIAAATSRARAAP